MNSETSGKQCTHKGPLSVALETPIAMAECHQCGQTVSVVFLLHYLQRQIDEMKNRMDWAHV